MIIENEMHCKFFPYVLNKFQTMLFEQIPKKFKNTHIFSDSQFFWPRFEIANVSSLSSEASSIMLSSPADRSNGVMSLLFAPFSKHQTGTNKCRGA